MVLALLVALEVGGQVLLAVGVLVEFWVEMAFWYLMGDVMVGMAAILVVVKWVKVLAVVVGILAVVIVVVVVVLVEMMVEVVVVVVVVPWPLLPLPLCGASCRGTQQGQLQPGYEKPCCASPGLLGLPCKLGLASPPWAPHFHYYLLSKVAA
jgi:hypothetical protein